MPAIRLRDAADLLTNKTLIGGVIKTLSDRGADDILAKMDLVSFQGSSFDWNIEVDELDQNTLYDPYTDDVATGIGTTERVSVKTGALAADVKTPLYNIISKSDYVRQKTEDVESGTSKVGRDFIYHIVNGMGVALSADAFGLIGFEGWLEFFAGLHNPSTTPTVPAGWARPAGHVVYFRQKMYGTSDGKITADVATNGLPLNDVMLRRLRRGNIGDPYTVIYTDEDSCVEIETILAGLPGNDAKTHMDADFGREMMTYNGMPIVILDAAGRRKKTGGAAATQSDATITISSSQMDGQKFIGFSDLDVGRKFKLDDGTNTWEGTIASVTTGRVVEATTTAPETFSNTDTTMTLEPTNVIYAVTYHNQYGFHGLFHESRGMPANPGQNYAGAVAGFSVRDKGEMEAGRKELVKMDWFGQFVCRKPYAIRRLSHYKLASAGNKYYFFENL